jgi:hypothetical protein
MGENIDPTWIAWHADRDLSPSWAAERLALVERHYAQLVDYPQAVSSAGASRVGVAAIADAEPACRWSHFAADDALAVTTAYVPTGWERITGSVDLPQAPLALAGRIAASPASAARKLNAPVAIAVVDRVNGELTIVNDALGAARAYEAAGGGVRAWSNRPGALVIFLGLDARADARGWLVLAGAGWFLGEASPIAGVRKLPGGTVIRAGVDGVAERRSNALSDWVRPEAELEALAAEAHDDALAQARAAAELWPGVARVDLSGGRDSRLAAAAVIAAGTPAKFRTSDATPGEAEVARRLIAAAPGNPEHRVTRTQPGSATPSTALFERAANLHLLHDGVRHPQKLRGKNTLPRPRPKGALFSGHGGEIAHGFFYKDARQLRRLRGKRRVRARLMRFFTKGHEAAQPDAYDEVAAIVDGSMRAGEEAGLKGPVLLDFFYLTERFAHRSGLATDSERVSVFATPGFVRAAFALKPADRLADRLHLDLIGRLVPEWRDQPFFDPAARPAKSPGIRRDRLWEVESDAALVEELLAGGGSWTDLYRPGEARAAWQELRSGRGSPKWEAVFEGIVYRHTFDEHLDRLRRAGQG